VEVSNIVEGAVRAVNNTDILDQQHQGGVEPDQTAMWKEAAAMMSYLFTLERLFVESENVQTPSSENEVDYRPPTQANKLTIILQLFAGISKNYSKLGIIHTRCIY